MAKMKAKYWGSVCPSIIKFSLEAIEMIPEQFNRIIWSQVEVS